MPQILQADRRIRFPNFRHHRKEIVLALSSMGEGQVNTPINHLNLGEVMYDRPQGDLP